MSSRPDRSDVWRFTRRSPLQRARRSGAGGLLQAFVERVLELLARLELSRAAGGNLDRFAGLRIASGPRLARRHRERSKARYIDPLALLEGRYDVVEHDIDGSLGIRL